MKQYVYVMKSESGLVKIGVSIRPEVRRAAIETGNGFLVSVVRLFGPFNMATSVESAAHAFLMSQRRRGEWFDCDVESAVAAVERAVAEFVDQPDSDPRDCELEIEALAKWAASGVVKPAEDFIKTAEALMSRHEALSNEYANLTDQFVEACELVDFYADHAKQTNLIAQKAFEQIGRLERQVAELKSLNEVALH